MVREWENHGAINPKAKLMATIMIIVAISFPLYFYQDRVPNGGKVATIVLVSIGWLYLISRPSGPQDR